MVIHRNEEDPVDGPVDPIDPESNPLGTKAKKLTERERFLGALDQLTFFSKDDEELAEQLLREHHVGIHPRWSPRVLHTFPERLQLREELLIQKRLKAWHRENPGKLLEDDEECGYISDSDNAEPPEDQLNEEEMARIEEVVRRRCEEHKRRMALAVMRALKWRWIHRDQDHPDPTMYDSEVEGRVVRAMVLGEPADWREEELSELETQWVEEWLGGGARELLDCSIDSGAIGDGIVKLEMLGEPEVDQLQPQEHQEKKQVDFEFAPIHALEAELENNAPVDEEGYLKGSESTHTQQTTPSEAALCHKWLESEGVKGSQGAKEWDFERILYPDETKIRRGGEHPDVTDKDREKMRRAPYVVYTTNQPSKLEKYKKEHLSGEEFAEWKASRPAKRLKVRRSQPPIEVFPPGYGPPIDTADFCGSDLCGGGGEEMDDDVGSDVVVDLEKSEGFDEKYARIHRLAHRRRRERRRCAIREDCIPEEEDPEDDPKTEDPKTKTAYSLKALIRRQLLRDPGSLAPAAQRLEVRLRRKMILQRLRLRKQWARIGRAAPRSLRTRLQTAYNETGRVLRSNWATDRTRTELLSDAVRRDNKPRAVSVGRHRWDYSNPPPEMGFRKRNARWAPAKLQTTNSKYALLPVAVRFPERLTPGIVLHSDACPDEWSDSERTSSDSLEDVEEEEEEDVTTSRGWSLSTISLVSEVADPLDLRTLGDDSLSQCSSLIHVDEDDDDDGMEYMFDPRLVSGATEEPGMVQNCQDWERLLPLADIDEKSSDSREQLLRDHGKGDFEVSQPPGGPSKALEALGAHWKACGVLTIVAVLCAVFAMSSSPQTPQTPLRATREANDAVSRIHSETARLGRLVNGIWLQNGLLNGSVPMLDFIAETGCVADANLLRTVVAESTMVVGATRRMAEIRAMDWWSVVDAKTRETAALMVNVTTMKNGTWKALDEATAAHVFKQVDELRTALTTAINTTEIVDIQKHLKTIEGFFATPPTALSSVMAPVQEIDKLLASLNTTLFARLATLKTVPVAGLLADLPTLLSFGDVLKFHVGLGSAGDQLGALAPLAQLNGTKAKALTTLCGFLESIDCRAPRRLLVGFAEGRRVGRLADDDLKDVWLREMLNDGAELRELRDALKPLLRTAAEAEAAATLWDPPAALLQSVRDDETLLGRLEALGDIDTATAAVRTFLVSLMKSTTTGSLPTRPQLAELCANAAHTVSQLPVFLQKATEDAKLIYLNQSIDPWGRLAKQVYGAANATEAIRVLQDSDVLKEHLASIDHLSALFKGLNEDELLSRMAAMSSDQPVVGKALTVFNSTDQKVLMDRLGGARESIATVYRAIRVVDDLSTPKRLKRGAKSGVNLAEALEKIKNIGVFDGQRSAKTEELAKLADARDIAEELARASATLGAFHQVATNEKDIVTIRQRAKEVDAEIARLSPAERSGWPGAAKLEQVFGDLGPALKDLRAELAKVDDGTDLGEFSAFSLPLDDVAVPALDFVAMSTALSTLSTRTNSTAAREVAKALEPFAGLQMASERRRSDNALPAMIERLDAFFEEFFAVGFLGRVKHIYPYFLIVFVGAVLGLAYLLCINCSEKRWRRANRYKRLPTEEQPEKREQPQVVRSIHKSNRANERKDGIVAEPTTKSNHSRRSSAEEHSTKEAAAPTAPTAPKKKKKKSLESLDKTNWLTRPADAAPLLEWPDELPKDDDDEVEEEPIWKWIPFSDEQRAPLHDDDDVCNSDDLRSIDTITDSTGPCSTDYAASENSDDTQEADEERHERFDAQDLAVRRDATALWHGMRGAWAMPNLEKLQGFHNERQYVVFRDRVAQMQQRIEDMEAKEEECRTNLTYQRVQERWNRILAQDTGLAERRKAYKAEHDEMMAQQAREQAAIEAAKRKRKPEENVERYVSESYLKDADREFRNVIAAYASVEPIDNFILSYMHDRWEHLFRTHTSRYAHDWARLKFTVDTTYDYAFYDACLVYPWPDAFERIIPHFRHKICVASAPMFAHAEGILWHMLYDNDVPLLVMLNQLVERHFMTCRVFFPVRRGQQKRFRFNARREYLVKCMDMRVMYTGTALERHLRITPIVDGIKGAPKFLNLLHMLDWPPEGIPLKWNHYVDVCERINECAVEQPVVIMSMHGCGRASTLALSLIAAIVAPMDDDVSIHTMVHGGRASKRNAVTCLIQVYFWRMVHYELLFRWYPNVAKKHRCNMDVRAEVWEDTIVGYLTDFPRHEELFFGLMYEWEYDRWRRHALATDHLRRWYHKKRRIFREAGQQRELFEARAAAEAEANDERSPYLGGQPIRRKPLRIGDAPRDAERPVRVYAPQDLRRICSPEDKLYTELGLHALVAGFRCTGMYQWVLPAEMKETMRVGVARPDNWREIVDLSPEEQAARRRRHCEPMHVTEVRSGGDKADKKDKKAKDKGKSKDSSSQEKKVATKMKK